MLRAKALLVFFVLLLLFSWFTSSGIWKRIKANNSIHTKKETRPANTIEEKLKKKSVDAIDFVKKNGYNESVCFLIDMTLPSGQNRFFIYDNERYYPALRPCYTWPLQWNVAWRKKIFQYTRLWLHFIRKIQDWQLIYGKIRTCIQTLWFGSNKQQRIQTFCRFTCTRMCTGNRSAGRDLPKWWLCNRISSVSSAIKTGDQPIFKSNIAMDIWIKNATHENEWH